MDSWQATLRLTAVTIAVILFYLLGRWVAEALQALVAGGRLPTL